MLLMPKWVIAPLLMPSTTTAPVPINTRINVPIVSATMSGDIFRTRITDRVQPYHIKKN
jgi:hypothetical protein